MSGLRWHCPPLTSTLTLCSSGSSREGRRDRSKVGFFWLPDCIESRRSAGPFYVWSGPILPCHGGEV